MASNAAVTEKKENVSDKYIPRAFSETFFSDASLQMNQ